MDQTRAVAHRITRQPKVIKNGVINEERDYSFELFRRHLQDPETVTYDDLLERAKLLVEHP